MEVKNPKTKKSFEERLTALCDEAMTNLNRKEEAFIVCYANTQKEGLALAIGCANNIKAILTQWIINTEDGEYLVSEALKLALILGHRKKDLK